MPDEKTLEELFVLFSKEPKAVDAIDVLLEKGNEVSEKEPSPTNEGTSSDDRFDRIVETIESDDDVEDALDIEDALDRCAEQILAPDKCVYCGRVGCQCEGCELGCDGQGAHSNSRGCLQESSPQSQPLSLSDLDVFPNDDDDDDDDEVSEPEVEVDEDPVQAGKRKRVKFDSIPSDSSSALSLIDYGDDSEFPRRTLRPRYEPLNFSINIGEETSLENLLEFYRAAKVLGSRDTVAKIGNVIEFRDWSLEEYERMFRVENDPLLQRLLLKCSSLLSSKIYNEDVKVCPGCADPLPDD